MKIQEVIDGLKKYHGQSWNGIEITEENTRDRVLYGNTNKECTGIVTTCFASVDVIEEAHKHNCNLIICHEALFWNHGDHTDWLEDNTVFRKKRALLDAYHICVWRDHDHIHAGIPVNGRYVDGIFYGLAQELGWTEYITGNIQDPRTFVIPPVSAYDLAKELIHKLHLNGTRIIGDPDTVVHKVRVPMHIMGDQDNMYIETTEKEHVDALLTMEMTDYTVQEYIRDSAMLQRPKAIIAIGHFNIEEPGMKYMCTWLPEITGNIPVFFIQSGDAYQYVTGE